MNKKKLRPRLLAWYDENKRTMPWRECTNPYFIWVSEIMLQQTRVDQAEPYFNRFIERFPTVFELAKADQQEVLKIWEGLGYYSRARYLHEAAQTVVNDYDGQVPDSRSEILNLKGIGPYTAAAVLSIAYQKPHAAVDGNVIRVLSRFFGIEKDVTRSKTKSLIQDYADDFIDQKRPGDFNQALMELGGSICTPTEPDCSQCPLQTECVAYRTLKVDEIPYKAPKKKVPHHNIGVGILINDENEVLIAQRPEEAMLGGLWEFPGGKQKENETMEETTERELKEELDIEISLTNFLMKLDHAYSHFKITLHAYLCKPVEGRPKANASQQIKWVPVDHLDDYPFPKANRRITEKLMTDFE